MNWKQYHIAEICRIEKGSASAQNEAPGPYPMVVTAKSRKSSIAYQFDGEAVCIPLVSSTGHGNAAINRVHYQNGKFAVASILAAIVPDPSIVCTKYLFHYFSALKDRILVPLMRGTSNVTLTIKNLKGVEISIPDLDAQVRIVATLDAAVAQLQERKISSEEMERDADAMLFNAFQEIIERADYRSMAEVAPQVRRPVSVDIDGEYPELGVRSFGKGTFHKPTLSGADVGSKRIYQFKEGDLVFSNVFSWEGAIAVAKPEDDARVGSHRFITCVPEPETATSEFLRYYFLTPEGLAKIGTASPGGAGRNRTLGLKKLEKLLVPIPNIEKQRWFDGLCAKVHEMKQIRAAANKDAEALIPAMLHEIFERPKVVPVQAEKPKDNVIAFPDAPPTKIDTSFKEAVLVGAIIKAFHADGGQPLGNFRLQKGVYFARRFMGEQALEQEFLRKAAGPYNPSMRYSGGFSIAVKKDWICPETGEYGKGHAPGKSASEMDEWIEKYQLAKPAAWVHDKFKFRKNDQWELLATIDYAILALNAQNADPSPANILEYISNDKEWHPKIEKLRLTEATIQNAMVELQTLFADVEAK